MSRTSRTLPLRVTVNGDPLELPDGATVADLVDRARGTRHPAGVAVAVASSVVPRGEWERRVLRPGEAVEIVTAVQGG
ncbi:sulfur carrier protein ThiS [Nocardioides insulae]|uniref:sulfur carrier protein ThiS n=1 Tax=Nocardioides insulae TaxID=394734 RepID=UPI0003F5C6A6|nr:sulfur carrier protein ThiS [Nocardioides insulae]